MFVYYAPVIHILKETALIASEQVNTVCNIKGKLGSNFYSKIFKNFKWL